MGDTVQDNLPVEDPQATVEVSEGEQIPAWAVELRKQNETAIEAMKVAQGQARRAEQRADVLQDTVNRLIANQQAAHPEQSQKDATEDLLSQLDDADPATRVIKQALRDTRKELIATRNEVAQLRGHRQRQEISEQEQGIRNHNAQALMEFAEDMEVDIKAVSEDIQRLPTGEMWNKGRQLIREAKKASKGNGSASKEHIDALRESGKFGEQRRGAGGVAVTDDASFLADYNAGKSKDHARAMRLTGYKP